MIQYDFLAGLDPSALTSITQAQLLQMINQIAPLSNIGGIVYQPRTTSATTDVAEGTAGSPDVTNNPRFARYIWLNTFASPPTPYYYNTGTSQWSIVAVPSGSIVNASIAAGAAIDVTKLAFGTARYLLRTNAAGTANEFITPAAALISNELPVVKLTANGSDGYLKTIAGVTQWVSDATDRAAVAASLSALNPTVLSPGANNTLLGTNGAGVVKFDSPVNLLANGAISLPLLAAGGASSGDILKYDGTNWVKSTPTIQIFGVATINTGIVVGVLGGAAIFTQAHGLGAKPSLVRVVLRCDTADLAYVAGDELDIFCIRSNATNNNSSAVTSDSANIVVTLTSAAGNEIPNKGTGAFAAMTEANWSLKIYAWR